VRHCNFEQLVAQWSFGEIRPEKEHLMQLGWSPGSWGGVRLGAWDDVPRDGDGIPSSWNGVPSSWDGTFRSFTLQQGVSLASEALASAVVQPTFELIPGVIGLGSPDVHSG
jgi:hypothetical protein